MLVKAVADNLGMSKMKYKSVYAVLCFYSVWDILIMYDVDIFIIL